MYITALSVVGHLLVLLAVVRAQPEPPHAVELEPITVALVTPPPPPVEIPKPTTPAAPSLAPPTPPKDVPKPAPPKDTKPPPKRIAARPTPAPPDVIDYLLAGQAQEGEADAEVSDAELAGAATAGSGGSGGGCNMPRLLEEALRSHRRVRAAVADAHRGKAIRVWNGDWVRHSGEDGNGLAAVREAIMWEIAFAPKECRTMPVRGLVMISLNDGPVSHRLVVGSDRWRWSDLLLLKPTLRQ